MKSPNLVLRVPLVFMLLAVAFPAYSQSPSDAPSSAGFKVGEVPTTLKDGDILFHDSGSDQSIAIKILTHSAYSHVGIYLRDANGGYVYEAHNKVEKTPIAEWSARPSKAAHPNFTPWKALRLKDHPEGLSSDEAAKLKALFTPKVMGLEYDKLFQWSDDKLYCSELVWKAYKKALNVKVGEPETFGKFDFTSKDAKELAEKRYGSVDNVPKDEIVVTPQAIYKSDNLMLVPPLTVR